MCSAAKHDEIQTARAAAACLLRIATVELLGARKMKKRKILTKIKKKNKANEGSLLLLVRFTLATLCEFGK
jgi:hypothetical protein